MHSEKWPMNEPVPVETEDGVVVAVDLDGTVHRMKPEPYTPTTEDVRRDYAAMRDEHMYSPSIAKARAYRENGGGAGEFDRWLRAHDAEVIERYADSFEYQGGRARDAREYAARIRRGEGE